MSKAADAPRPNADPGRFWMRAGLLASVLGMVLVIWASHIYLTRAFSEDQDTDATVRATLYAGSIQSSMQRHSVVPLLLSRDPILILALRIGPVRRRRGAAGDLPGGDRRRLDLPARRRGPHRGGERRAAARAVRRRQRPTSRWRRPTPAPSSRSSRTTTAPTASTTRAASCRTTSCSAWSWSPSTSASTRRAGGGRGSKVVVTDSEDQVLLASEPNWRKQTLTNLLARRPGPVAGPPGDPRRAAQHRRARLRLHRRHAAPASSRCRSGSATGA